MEVKLALHGVTQFCVTVTSRCPAGAHRGYKHMPLRVGTHWHARPCIQNHLHVVKILRGEAGLGLRSGVH